MSSALLMVLRAILAVPVLLAGASKAPAGAADRIEARIEIFGFAGFHVLTNSTTVEEAGDRYSIVMDLDTRGLARVFVDLTSHSEVHGRVARDTARPDAYRAEVRRNGIDRSYGVDYRSDGAVINASTPPSPGWSLSVPAELIRGTVDQPTAYFLLEHQLSSRPEDSHLRALPDPYVNLSIHTAPDVRPFPWQSRQWAKSVGLARRSRSNQSRAPLVLRRNRLNLRRAQRMT